MQESFQGGRDFTPNWVNTVAVAATAGDMEHLAHHVASRHEAIDVVLDKLMDEIAFELVVPGIWSSMWQTIVRSVPFRRPAPAGGRRGAQLEISRGLVAPLARVVVAFEVQIVAAVVVVATELALWAPVVAAGGSGRCRTQVRRAPAPGGP